MRSINFFTALTLLLDTAMALPEAGVARAVEVPQPEVVRAVDLEDRNRDRRSCVAGAGGNVCTNGPYPANQRRGEL
ncbi:hypothetical protein SUNI508_11810 [Seiridium unicorne]|uniref:Uncharacterized protein n=1 Tax=Seiridium unicorne TaxID=138068 RepID=A0ABR2UGJ1_9PEZI